jgi:glucokinase
MDEKYFLGIDMGGTAVKIAVVSGKKEIVDSTSHPTDPTLAPIVLLSDILDAAKNLKHYEDAKTIGVGIAGNLDFKQGLLQFSCNLPKWNNVPIRDILAKMSGKRVVVDNDGNTATFGSYMLDADSDTENLVCLTLGTGIGCGFIINRRLYRGSYSIAGEIGHCIVNVDGNLCACGNRGCLEAYLGANHITDYAIDYLKKNKSEIVENLVEGDLSKVTPEIVYKACTQGCPIAIEIYKWAGMYLGILLMNVINFVDPDTIVLCGGISNAGNFILDPAFEYMRKNGFANKIAERKILVSKWKNKLGVVGCAMLPDAELK